LEKEQRIEIIPIVEISVLQNLKGFIHKEIEVYTFDNHIKAGIENKFFKAVCKKVAKYLNNKLETEQNIFFA